MDNMDELLLRSPEESASVAPEVLADSAEANIRITDRRVGQLLIALHEVDFWVREQGTVSEQQVEELVGAAILACGFTDPIEAQSVVAPILDAIWPSRGYS